MALDIEKLRQKLKETQEKTANQGGDFAWWSPKDGRNKIRVLPPKGDREEYFAETAIHYNLGPDKNKQVVCRKAAGHDDCPVCELREALLKSKDEDDKSLAKDIRAVAKYYYNVFDETLTKKDDNYKKPLIYGSGITVFEEILTAVCDPDIGDVTHAETGRNITITRKGKGRKTEYTVQVLPNEAPVDDIEDLDEQLHDIEALTKAKEYDEIVKIMEGDESEEEEEEEKPKKKKKDEKKKKNVKKVEEEEEDDDDDDDEDDNEDDDNDEDDDDEGEDDEELDDVENEIANILNKHKK